MIRFYPDEAFFVLFVQLSTLNSLTPSLSRERGRDTYHTQLLRLSAMPITEETKEAPHQNGKVKVCLTNLRNLSDDQIMFWC